MASTLRNRCKGVVTQESGIIPHHELQREMGGISVADGFHIPQLRWKEYECGVWGLGAILIYSCYCGLLA